jgi:octaprenyl-diphosphate synthase
MTLPLIHVLNQTNSENKKWLINSIKNHNKDKKRVKAVVQFVKDNNGLQYAENKMNWYKDQALNILNTYEDSSYKEALILMVNYVIDRKI